MRSTDAEALLRIEKLDVHYGQAHALQGVSLALGEGVLAVVGRNGMGKSTLCKAVTGLVPATGSIRFDGHELLGRSPDEITRLGIAYVPQGRRVWRSLTVHETLQLAAGTARQGAWTVDRVYRVFPRLAERRDNGGAQLSGGEQQMLAIGRALLYNPRLLVMDEPTEGLAPVIVEQVATLLKDLARDRTMSVLLVEQNLGAALEVADRVAVMVNGRIAHNLPAGELAADRALQQRLLGLKAGAAEGASDEEAAPASTSMVFRIVRAHGGTEDMERAPDYEEPAPGPAPIALPPEPDAPASGGPVVCLAGAWGSQQRELAHARRCLEELGVSVLAVDIAGGPLSIAAVGPRELLRHHPDPARFGRFAGGAVDALDLAPAFANFLRSRDDVGALLAIVREPAAASALAGAAALPATTPRLLLLDAPARNVPAGVFTVTPGADREAAIAQAAAALAGMLRAAGRDTRNPRTASPSPRAPLFH